MVENALLKQFTQPVLFEKDQNVLYILLYICFLLSDASELKLVITRTKLFPCAPVVRLVIF